MAEARKEEEYVYRISSGEEWQELQSSGSTFGGELDKNSGFIHLSKLSQVQSTLQNFFLNTKVDLYLLQIDAKKLGKGLVYEVVDGSNSFPHFYGPSRSFSPLSLDAVTKAEKLSLSGSSPLIACCGLGDQPYNYNLDITCEQTALYACDNGLRFISRDGITESS